MRVVQTKKGNWVIIGIPDPTCTVAGRYTTRKAAEEDRLGIERFIRANRWLFPNTTNTRKKK